PPRIPPSRSSAGSSMVGATARPRPVDPPPRPVNSPPRPVNNPPRPVRLPCSASRLFSFMIPPAALSNHLFTRIGAHQRAQPRLRFRAAFLVRRILSFTSFVSCVQVQQFMQQGFLLLRGLGYLLFLFRRQFAFHARLPLLWSH